MCTRKFACKMNEHPLIKNQNDADGLSISSKANKFLLRVKAWFFPFAESL